MEECRAETVALYRKTLQPMIGVYSYLYLVVSNPDILEIFQVRCFVLTLT